MINRENLIKIGRAGGNTSNRKGWNLCKTNFDSTAIHSCSLTFCLQLHVLRCHLVSPHSHVMVWSLGNRGTCSTQSVSTQGRGGQRSLFLAPDSSVNTTEKMPLLAGKYQTRTSASFSHVSKVQNVYKG